VGGAVADFWLANVRLYNYSTAGHVAPAALPPTAPAGDRYDGYDITQWSNIPAGIKAYAPHLPTGVKAADDYIAYNADLSDTRDIVEYKDNIYAFETAAGLVYPAAGWKQNTCLVIGGYYQSTASPTYYRVEFKNAALLPLLRNHRYTVNITGVSAHGYPTPEDAYNNPPSNITVQITEWNDGGLDDITFNDQYHLAVDKSTLAFYAGGGSKSMEAITDFPAGWTIEKDAVYDWFTVSPTIHASTSQQTITVTIPNGTGPRDGHFDIVAGNLHKRIFVTQSAEEEFSIFITDLVTGKTLDELAFEAGNNTEYGALPAARSFRVTWFPVSADCEVTLTPVGMTPFTFNTTDVGIDPVAASPLTGGSAIITIQPDPLSLNAPNPLSRLDFTVTRGDQHRTAVLYLRQVNNYVIVESVAADYLADGTTTHSFTVKSNCQWLSYLDDGGSDLDDLINWKTFGGGPNPAGESFEFILNVRSNPAPATISFTNLDHSITYTTATIHGASPYLTLDETTYDTNNAAAHSKEVTMSTNIPATQLSATVTGTGGIVTGATIEAGPKLKVNLDANTLVGSTETYTVDVKYNNQTIATLTVRVTGSTFRWVNGKAVAGTLTNTTYRAIISGTSLCPSGSRQPYSEAEARWYETNLGNMSGQTYLLKGTGINESQTNINGAVVWSGASMLTDTGGGIRATGLYQGTVYVTTLNNFGYPTRGIAVFDNIGNGVTYTTRFYCVIW
jgi:hypothetical protein